MKTVEITYSEMTTLLTALRIVNSERRQFVKDPMFRDGIKDRIRLFRKMVKMQNVRGDVY